MQVLVSQPLLTMIELCLAKYIDVWCCSSKIGCVLRTFLLFGKLINLVYPPAAAPTPGCTILVRII